MMAPEKKRIAVDVDEFVRTRDALTTAFLGLSTAVDKAVKAYIEHTNAVLAGDTSLNVSYLTQPFNALSAAASLAEMTGKAISKTPADLVDAPTADDADEVKVKGKKGKRAYKPRDPNAPKRPITAYFRYLAEMRPLLTIELAKNIGNHKPGELSVVATERWKELSEEQKRPYHDAYKAAKVVYDQEVQDYKSRTGQLVVDGEDEEDDGTQTVGALTQPSATPAALDGDDSDDEDSSDDSPPPPPPPKVKKSSSPEAVKKTPKAAKTTTVEKTPKTAKAIATPMFNSIGPGQPGTEKKRKAAAADDGQPKKKRGRPSNADKLLREQAAQAAAAEEVSDSSTDSEPQQKKEKPKKKKTAEA